MNKKINLEQRSSCGVSSSVGTYRADIDGLRALAVLAVVIFHIEPAVLTGGFVGVDIFFVISGFLITGNIVSAKERGTFSYSEFYRRRIKRILPVLFFVILSTLLVAQFVFLPEDFVRLADSALASQLSIANVYFTYFLDTSYFADDAGLEPLLHLWSLGVEEQFYFLWPLLLLVGLRVRRFGLLTFVFVLMILSCVLGELLASQSPMFAYYMLPTRAFQLLMGGLCFLLINSGLLSGSPSRLIHFSSWIGFLLVVASATLLDDSMRYPGVNALPVTLGAAMLMWTGAFDNIVSRILSLKPLVLVGLVSYSLYLWHWPVLAFSKYVLVELTLTAKFIAFVVMLLLSAASYRFIEQPFRSTHKKFSFVLFVQFIIPTIVIVLLVWGIKYTNGVGIYMPEESYVKNVQRSDDEPEPATRALYVCQAQLVTENMLRSKNCRINADLEPPILLWGDSNAGHYVGVIKEVAELYDFGFRNIAHSACPPVLSRPDLFVSDSKKKNCLTSVNRVKANLEYYSVVIIAASWPSYFKHLGFQEAFSETVHELKAQGKTVILLGKVPVVANHDKECLKKRSKLPFLDCDSKTFSSRAIVESQNRWLQDMARELGIGYLDVTGVLCQQNLCFSGVEGKSVYFDTSHLSRGGSETVGKKLLSNLGPSLSLFNALSDVPYIPAAESWVSTDYLQDVNPEGMLSLLDRNSWIGKGKIESMENRLIFSDFSDRSFIRWMANLADTDGYSRSLQTNESLYIDLKMRRNSSSSMLFRVELKDHDKEKEVYDYVINPSFGTVMAKKHGKLSKWSVVEFEEMLHVKILLPEVDAEKILALYLYPAAANNRGSYVVEETGSVEFDSISIGAVIKQ